MSKSNQDVPRNKDGTPDKRTVEGREAAAKEGDKNYKPGNDDVPRNKDGTPDKRTVEGREAASVEGDSNKHTIQTRLDGEVDKRTVEGREQVHDQSKDGKDQGKDQSKDQSKDQGKDHGKSGSHDPEFEEGDNVVFNIGSNNLHGTISRVITKDSEVDGRIAHGTKDEPRYAVKYEGTGVEQIRTEGALQKDEGQPTNDAGGKYSERGPASSSSSSSGTSGSSPRTTRNSSSSSSPRRDDRYRKGHKFEEGETVVFHIGNHELHGKIARVTEKGGHDAYKVKVGDDTITAAEKDLEKDKSSKSGSSSSSASSSSSGSSSGSHSHGDHKFSEGDAVTFNIGLNDLHGTITKVITKDTEVDGRIAHGSKDEPRYAVKYEGTGVEQIRTESALKADEDKMDEDKSNKRKREEESKDKKDDVPRNKDGTPDKRTVEGREAAAKESKEPSPKKSKTK